MLRAVVRRYYFFKHLHLQNLSYFYYLTKGTLSKMHLRLLNMKNETIGERIRARRKTLKMSQVLLAKAVCVSDVAISQWERSETEPTLCLWQAR